jgi:hypothetical protein
LTSDNSKNVFGKHSRMTAKAVLLSSTLDERLLIHIFEYLDHRGMLQFSPLSENSPDLCRVCQVNSRFRRLSLLDMLWEPLYVFHNEFDKTKRYNMSTIMHPKRNFKAAFRREKKYLSASIRYMMIARIADHVPLVCYCPHRASSDEIDNEFDQMTFITQNYCKRIVNTLDSQYISDFGTQKNEHMNIAITIEALSSICYLNINIQFQFAYLIVTAPSVPKTTAFLMLRELNDIVVEDYILCQMITVCGFADLGPHLKEPIRQLFEKYTSLSIAADEEYSLLIEELQSLSIVSFKEQFQDS